MKKPRIYIDTSIVGGCFDEEFATESRALIEKAKQGELELIVSELLIQELRQAPSDVRGVLAGLPEDSVERVSVTEETVRLRDVYLADGVVGVGSTDDAHHVAIATVNRADMIVSWNFRHIVHYEKIRRFNAVNLREGYSTISIYSPKEVV